MSTSRGAKETVAAGCALAACARAGDIFALVGELGAGKTQLVKGIARGLGSSAEITSPTFTLLHEYRGGRLPLYHFDFYRLGSKDEALQLGLDDYLFGDGLCAIEWADRFPQLLPERTRWISLRIASNGERVIEAP